VEAQTGASKTTSKLTATKPVQQAFSLPYAHFIEHHMSVIKKSPQNHNEKLEKFKSWIRYLKDKTGFHLKQLHQVRNLKRR
jgi:hypothetical protein